MRILDEEEEDLDERPSTTSQDTFCIRLIRKAKEARKSHLDKTTHWSRTYLAVPNLEGY